MATCIHWILFNQTIYQFIRLVANSYTYCSIYAVFATKKTSTMKDDKEEKKNSYTHINPFIQYTVYGEKMLDAY